MLCVETLDLVAFISNIRRSPAFINRYCRVNIDVKVWLTVREEAMSIVVLLVIKTVHDT